jgi:hypothetical protein
VDRLHELRALTDRVLRDLKVTPELQAETLRKIRQPRRRARVRPFVSFGASMAAVTLGILLYHNHFSGQDSVAEPPVMTGMEIHTSINSLPPLLPLYLPDNFRLRESASVEDESGRIVNSATFEGGDDYCTVTQSNRPLPYDAEQFEPVNLQGITGHCAVTAQGEVILVWRMGDVHYKLEGTLSKSEMVKIAISIPG